MQRLGIYKKTPSKKKGEQLKDWVSGTYPGEKVQVDVKYVPSECMSPELKRLGEKFYQYTAIDEFTRIRYTWFTNEHSTYTSSEFVKKMVKYFKQQNFSEFILKYFSEKFCYVLIINYLPVEPNPPSPRSVLSRVATSSHSTLSYFATTNCAILSPGLTTNFSFERLIRITLISPR